MVRSNLPRTALLLAALAAPTALAQSPTHTVPNGLLNNEGDARHWVPAHFAPCFSQSTYASSFVDLPTGNISQIWLRPDSAPATMQAHTFDVSIRMSSQGVPEPSAVFTHSYSANRGTDHATVLSSQPVSFPAHTPSGSGPQPWTVSIPIQPFAYQSGNPLQIEWNVEAPAAGAQSPEWFADAEHYSIPANSGYFIRDHYRNACPAQNTIYAGVVGGPGDTMSIWFYSESGPGLPAVMFVGTSETQWGGVPLPFDLTPYGFPGCAVRVDQVLAFYGVTDATGGRFRVDYRIPRIQALRGNVVFTQNFVLDPSFGGGLRASDRGKITFGNFLPTLPARHLYTYGATIDDAPEHASAQVPVIGLRQ